MVAGGAAPHRRHGHDRRAEDDDGAERCSPAAVRLVVDHVVSCRRCCRRSHQLGSGRTVRRGVRWPWCRTDRPARRRVRLDAARRPALGRGRDVQLVQSRAREGAAGGLSGWDGEHFAEFTVVGVTANLRLRRRRPPRGHRRRQRSCRPARPRPRERSPGRVGPISCRVLRRTRIRATAVVPKVPNAAGPRTRLMSCRPR